MISEPALRALAAGVALLAYAILCLAIGGRERRRRGRDAQRAAALSAGAEDRAPTLVLHGSQSGQAEALAWRTARWLHDTGTPAQVKSLNDTDAETLRNARRALFIASTHGEGDAPDGASLFAEQVMNQRLDLSPLGYAVLALGDRQYRDFCGFGRRLDQWLQAAGARRSFERIEVDNAEPAALAVWQERVSGGAAPIALHETPPAPQPWRLVSRTLLNQGSVGAPVYELAFKSSMPQAPSWESGDLARLVLAGDPGRPRDYSIASIPEDGELQLLVRQERHPDGRIGAASGLLTVDLQPGDSVPLSLHAHGNFRLAGNAERPLILIGNGSGLAGLRGHLRARAAAGRHDNWLVFGERQAAHDFICRAELEAWQRSGVLQRLDLVFSRDQPERRYVQHRLLHQQRLLLQWLGRGAAIYVCGSLQGMAADVDAALCQIAGEALVGELLASGRYQRDVY